MYSWMASLLGRLVQETVTAYRGLVECLAAETPATLPGLARAVVASVELDHWCETPNCTNCNSTWYVVPLVRPERVVLVLLLPWWYVCDQVVLPFTRCRTL